MGQFASYDNLQLEYFVYGSGPKWMLAFHGYGRSASDFRIFEPHLGKNYSIISFNLFHHGNSFYPIERCFTNTLTKEELKKLFEVFFKEKNINRFSLIAYSIGGRLALTLAELFPNNVDSIQLFAPDGMRKSRWIGFLNFTNAGKFLYKLFIAKGETFIRLIDNLKKFKLLSRRLHHFAIMHIEYKEQRILLHKVWMTHRNIFPDTAKLKLILNTYKIDLELIIGMHDKVITPKSGRQFINYLNTENAKMTLVDAGHNVLKVSIIKQLRKRS